MVRRPAAAAIHSTRAAACVASRASLGFCIALRSSTARPAGLCRLYDQMELCALAVAVGGVHSDLQRRPSLGDAAQRGFVQGERRGAPRVALELQEHAETAGVVWAEAQRRLTPRWDGAWLYGGEAGGRGLAVRQQLASVVERQRAAGVLQEQRRRKGEVRHMSTVGARGAIPECVGGVGARGWRAHELAHGCAAYDDLIELRGTWRRTR